MDRARGHAAALNRFTINEVGPGDMVTKRRVTIKDVAAVAGVVPATVSYALNNSGPISRETRDRVLAAAADLGYSRNMLAASLRSNVTRTIGLILPNINNPFYSELAHGVEAIAQEHNYIVTYGNANYNPQFTARYLTAFAERRIDGVILAACTDEDMRLLGAHHVPIVVVDAHTTDTMPDLPMVEVENMLPARDLVAHLIRLGHRRIGLLTVNEANPRAQGYRLALQDAGIPLDPALVNVSHHVEPDLIAQGRRQTEQLLASARRPTAIFGITDLMAMGALSAIKEMALRVPEDIAVVGFDDIVYSALTAPPLTTVSQPKYRMGVAAMRLLLEAMEQENRPPHRKIVLQAHLVIRESCGARLARPVT